MNSNPIYKSLSDALEKELEDIIAYPKDSPLYDIGLTSITMISFIVEIEEQLNIEILDSDLLYENFSTLEKVFSTIEKYIEPPVSLKKCLILDADNVLWHGISGEEKIIIDEAILNFQSFLVELYERGVILCLCSKNDQLLIESSFNDPKMLLKKEHFAIFTANRSDKASNIDDIARELNLSCDSFVFADDSDYELGFVKLNLPSVTTLKVDYTSLDFKNELAKLFDSVHSSQDLNRTQLYREQKEREKEKRNFVSIEDYNLALQTKISCDIAKKEDCARLVELSARTNQFNLSDSHYTFDELSNLIDDSESTVLSLSVTDKYGDMGIVGMAVLRGDIIESFMLSCRVFDRALEFVILNKLKEFSKGSLRGIYRPNQKNSHYAEFYPQNGVLIYEHE